jgi:hypothetical protein
MCFGVLYFSCSQNAVLCFDGECVVQTLENMKVYLNYPITFIVCCMQQNLQGNQIDKIKKKKKKKFLKKKVSLVLNSSWRVVNNQLCGPRSKHSCLAPNFKRSILL